MSNEHDRRAPQPNQECPHPVDESVSADATDVVQSRFTTFLEDDECISMSLFKGPQTGYLNLHVGKPRRPHIFEFFVRDVPGTFLEGALPLLIDFVSGSLETYFAEDKDAYFPLDFTGHPFGDHVVFAKSQVRDLDAEAMAEAWLKAHDEV